MLCRYILKRLEFATLLRRLRPSYIAMNTSTESTEWTRENYMFGIDVDKGPNYFVSCEVKSEVESKLKLEGIGSFSSPEFDNGVFYNVSNSSEPQQDLVKSRISNSVLREHLETLSCKEIWSSFLWCTQRDIFLSGFTLKFEHNGNSGNLEKYTKNVINIARTFGLTSIAKLIPNANQGFFVDVISCETKDKVDQFEISPVEYSGYHPSFNYGHSVYKSLEEMQNVLELASKHAPLPEIQKFQNLAKIYKNKPSVTSEQCPHPFIVIEGLDAVGKSTLVGNLGKQLDAEIFCTPPSCIATYRELFSKQCQPVCRAFYTLGNYLIAENIKEAIVKHPVILDRFWYSSAAYAIAQEANCGDESNIPPKGHPIYQWPSDLLKPSAVIFLVLNEEERQVRMRQRGYIETHEEAKLAKSQLLRERLIAAYKNMDDPACIIIDASKNEEGVCNDVMTSLRDHKILT